MKVKLKRNFFSKDGVLYRAVRGGPTEVPNHLCKDLPKDAEIIKEAKPKAKAEVDVEAKVEGTEDGVVDFDAMNVPALKAYAKENHIDLAGAQSRAEVLAAIEKGQKDKSAEVDALLGQ